MLRVNKTNRNYSKHAFLNDSGLSQSGSTMLEFLIVVPVLIIFVAGIIEWSIVYTTSHVLQHMAREGARTASVLPSLVDNDPRVRAEVILRLPNLPILPDAAALQVTTNSSLTDAQTGKRLVRVEIRHSYGFIFLSCIGFGPVQILREALVYYEWVV